MNGAGHFMKHYLTDNRNYIHISAFFLSENLIAFECVKLAHRMHFLFNITSFIICFAFNTFYNNIVFKQCNYKLGQILYQEFVQYFLV